MFDFDDVQGLDVFVDRASNAGKLNRLIRDFLLPE